MDERYGSTLFKALGISALALVGLTALGLPPLVPSALSFLPLLLYHWLFLYPRAKTGLGRAAIDSIYYYGFLLTILALAASAVTLAINGVSESLVPVALQFGLGLFATGYSVAARLHLQAISTSNDVVEDGDVFDIYLSRSRDLISNIELAASSFGAFANSLIERTTTSADGAQGRVEALIKEAAAVFRSGIAASLDEAKQDISELRGLLNDAAFGAERVELKKSLQGSLAAVGKLNTALEKLADLSTTTTTASSDLASSFSTMRDSVAEVSRHLSELSDDEGGIAGFASAVASGTAEISTAARQMQSLGTEGQLAAERVAVAARAFDGMARAADEAKGSLQPFADTVSELEQAVSKAERMGQAFASIDSSANALSDELQSLGHALREVAPTFDAFGAAGQLAAPRLDAMREHIEQLEKFSGSLAPTAQVISDMSALLAQQGQRLTASITASERLMESLATIASAAPASTGAVGDLSVSINQLHAAIASVREQLLEGGGQFAQAVDQSVDALRKATATSSTSIESVSDNLAGLANFIIRKTQDRQAKP